MAPGRQKHERCDEMSWRKKETTERGGTNLEIQHLIEPQLTSFDINRKGSVRLDQTYVI